jgi:hypothetical protein
MIQGKSCPNILQTLRKSLHGVLLMLSEEEIEVGVVAEFSYVDLNTHPEVVKSESPMTRDGPLVCVWTNGLDSTWVELTLKPGNYNQRHAINPDQKFGGTKGWQDGVSYLNTTSYTGPNAAFIQATMPVDECSRRRPRRYITEQGVRGICDRLHSEVRP